jgi:hypothetical protein
MRKLKIIEHISLDGVIQVSGGTDDSDFPYGDWTAPYRICKYPLQGYPRLSSRLAHRTGSGPRCAIPMRTHDREVDWEGGHRGICWSRIGAQRWMYLHVAIDRVLATCGRCHISWLLSP